MATPQVPASGSEQNQQKEQAEVRKENAEKSEDKSMHKAAEDSKKEREDMQIPERKDEVIAPSETMKSTSDSGSDSPGKPWADYASEQEEAYKKNTGQDIERNVDGRVKP